MVHLVNFETTQLPIISVIIHWRLSLPESPYCGNTTFKKNSICLSRRGHRLAWSRIPSLLKLLNLAEVLAWGAGGRGFKSHWPHSIFTFYLVPHTEFNRMKLANYVTSQKNIDDVTSAYYLFKYSVSLKILGTIMKEELKNF